MLTRWGLWDGVRVKDRPKTVLAKVEALIRKILPDLSKEDIGNIILERSGLRKTACSSLLVQGENCELTMPALESSDAAEVSRFKKQQTATVSTKAGNLRWLKDQ